ncbi:phage protein [Vibrio fluvialis]|nr:phage protein [Vibrio fluvialis]
MKYHEMTKNYIFREFECGLTKEQTAELCFKSVRTVTEWDKGKDIPPECKRLMKLVKMRRLSTSSSWDGFEMISEKLKLPTGKLVTPQEILTGIALLEIDSITEISVKAKILKYARNIAKIMNNS